MARQRPSSRRWLDRQVSDPFVRRAHAEGYRSRAAFKLLELQQRDQLLRPGLRVVDLGAAPGGWCQVAAPLVGRTGRVIAFDLLAMEPLDGVEFIQGDFTDETEAQRLDTLLEGHPVDLVLSDMAPNVSGTKAVDQPRTIYLAELAHAFALSSLKPGGALVVKVFHGEGLDALVREMSQHFDKVVSRKPKASRSQSREAYLVAKGLRVG